MLLKSSLSMFVHPKLKLNKFRMVSVPKNKDLFFRVGKRPVFDMADGLVANFSNDTMNALSAVEDQYLKDNQMPSDTDVPGK